MHKKLELNKHKINKSLLIDYYVGKQFGKKTTIQQLFSYAHNSWKVLVAQVLKQIQKASKLSNQDF